MFFCDGFIFVTRRMSKGFEEHMPETVANIMSSGHPYSGVNFDIQLLLHIPSEMQIGEANVLFAGDTEQK